MPRSRKLMTRSRELMRKRGTFGSQGERHSHHPGFLQVLMLEDSLAQLAALIRSREHRCLAGDSRRKGVVRGAGGRTREGPGYH